MTGPSLRLSSCVPRAGNKPVSPTMSVCRRVKSKGCGLTLGLVRNLREHRVPATAEELAGFETDVPAGFVLAGASAWLAESTIRNDTGNLELIRDWFGRPLWEMQPADADACFSKVLRGSEAVDAGRLAALTVYFQYLELRHKIEILEPDRPGG